MNNISIICGTNRTDAISLGITQTYLAALQEIGVTASLIDLANLPPDFAFSALYENEWRNDQFNTLRELMKGSDKFVFIVPEYNGSFPGVLKTFIDGLEYPNTFRNKKCALVGVASGGQGSSLALSHLTDILNHCGTHVLAYKPRLMKIDEHFENGILNDRYTLQLKKQAQMLLNF
jgi:NAD(P)H-dependent FMN reductase